MKMKISKRQWEFIGKKAGWFKKASIGKFSGDATDVLEGMVVINKALSDGEILEKVKGDAFLSNDIVEMVITDEEILSYIRDIRKMYRI